MARIEIEALRKDWDGAVALDGIDLTIEEGEFVAVLGPSGCGKSTTLFLLAGLYRATGGEIRFDGARVNEVEVRDRNIGIVFQSYALYPNMTVLQNILFPLRFKQVAEPQTRALEMARLVQIEALLDRRPAQLSGGQQQRVALARALVKRPNLLLLDEPLSNLDATLRLTMRAEIRRIARDLGVTTVLVTHDQLEATTMADRIVCMRAGRIEQVGTADDLYARPETLFVAGFIGSPPMNLLPGLVAQGRMEQGGAAVAVTGHTGAATLGLRPEKIVAVDGPGLAARVIGVEPMGRETLYVADTGFGAVRFLEATSQARWHVGAALRLGFDPADTLLFDAAGRRIAGALARMTEVQHA